MLNQGPMNAGQRKAKNLKALSVQPVSNIMFALVLIPAPSPQLSMKHQAVLWVGIIKVKKARIFAKTSNWPFSTSMSTQPSVCQNLKARSPLG